MKQPDIDGRAVTKTLYDVGHVESKLSKPTDNYNLFGPPSLTPGISYPISEREERIRQQAYKQGDSDRMRMNRAGRLVEDDPVLDMYREIVEEERKKLIKKGKVDPVNEKERRWVK